MKYVTAARAAGATVLDKIEIFFHYVHDQHVDIEVDWLLAARHMLLVGPAGMGKFLSQAERDTCI